MTPQQAASKLVEAGFTQPEIVEALRNQGVVTSQAAISRIVTGEVVDPMFRLGQALINLCEAKTKKQKKSVA